MTDHSTDPTPGTIIELDSERKLTIGDKFAEGDLANLYDCTFTGPVPEPVDTDRPKTRYERLMEDDEDLALGGTQAVLKMVRLASDNDLLLAECRTLTYLHKAATGKFPLYLPELVHADYFSLWGRSACLLSKIQGHLTVAEILEAYPDGIDFRDMVWMFKRAMAVLGYAHKQGVIHGAVYPPHLLVHPIEHGIKLIDWCYSTHSRSSIKAYPQEYKAFVAPEVFVKQFPTPATDIYSLGMTAIALIGGNPETREIPDAVPIEVRDFLRRCVNEAPSERPQNAWDLHDEFNTLLRRVVGKPKYRRFSMPTGS